MIGAHISCRVLDRIQSKHTTPVSALPRKCSPDHPAGADGGPVRRLRGWRVRERSSIRLDSLRSGDTAPPKAVSGLSQCSSPIGGSAGSGAWPCRSAFAPSGLIRRVLDDYALPLLHKSYTW